MSAEAMDTEEQPDALQNIQDREASTVSEEGRVESAQPSVKSAMKRKHSPAVSTPQADSPAAAQFHDDSTTVADPPILIPHTANLPPSDHEFFATRSHPISRNGYRYTTCGPSTSQLLPAPLQRTIESPPQYVRFSWEDRSTFILLTSDAKTITAEKGWRAARANVGVREGNWYWEIKAERCGGEGAAAGLAGGEGSWVRVGVGRRESPLNAPGGFDGYSYVYRDRGGDAVTLARPTPYGKPYHSGATIGIYISLPTRPAPVDRRDPARIVRKRLPIRYKGQLYFELLEYASSKEMDELLVDPAVKAKAALEEKKKKKVAPGEKAAVPLADQGPPMRPIPKLEKAKIAFFLDGECQGVAYEDIYDFLPLRMHDGDKEREERKKADPRTNWHDDGTCAYYPHVSVFGGAIATINPGPDFAFPPPADIEAALRDSPHPPSSGPILDPKGKRRADGASEDLNWRPLCDRYTEYLAEQTHLDDLDEDEAVRVFTNQTRSAAEQAAAVLMGRENGGAPVKKGRPFVKREEDSPAAPSPRSGLRRGGGVDSDAMDVDRK